MKKSSRSDAARIEKALAHSFKKLVRIDGGPFWKARLMARIAEEGMTSTQNWTDRTRTIRAAWQSTFAAALVLVVVLAYAVNITFEARQTVAELALSDSPVVDIALDLEIL